MREPIMEINKVPRKLVCTSPREEAKWFMAKAPETPKSTLRIIQKYLQDLYLMNPKASPAMTAMRIEMLYNI